ncbi:uncharacterized protein [Drosophila tropicalis]|uniref:uncharacterized protein n=1 Tax=Drosophila tropicalis TaxID=46794 RepID=UPI0035AB930D
MSSNSSLKLQLFNICKLLITIIVLNEVTLVTVSAVEYYSEKPSFLPSCRIYEPGFTKCSTNSIQKLINQLSIGIPEVLETFGPFDPMRVRNVVFKQDNNEVATIRANLTELVVRGYSKTEIKESRVSKKDFSWQTKLFLPKMRLDGKYKMNGRILLIPLSGSGNIFIEIENLDILMLTKTRLYEKGGFTFYNLTSLRVHLNMTRVRTHLDNLFNGRSKEVERSTNQFFNDNWRDFYEALRPLIVETVESILLEWLSKVFHLIPANFFVEDIPTPQQLYGPKATASNGSYIMYTGLKQQLLKTGIVLLTIILLIDFARVSVAGVEYYSEKPSFLPSCRIYEPGFTKCSTNSVQKLIDQLGIGIPEVLESFGPFDPMRVRDIIFKQDNNEVATLRANLTELVVKGFSKTKIKESRVSKKDFSWQTKLFLPKMRLDGKYKMNGRILLIPLSGSGNIFIEIENLDILMLTKTRLYEKGGFTFDNVTSVRVHLNITRVRTHLDNLFNGRSKEVERSTNQFFNDNWRDFYEALRPLIVETVESILLEVMSLVFNLIPANFFVEDIPTSQQLYGTKAKTSNDS